MSDGSTFAWPEYANGEKTLAHFAADDAIVESVNAAFIDDLCST